jgi:PPP family 3-phenylpropionic acid transporter
MSVALLAGAGTIMLFPAFKSFAPILLLAVLFNLFFAPIWAFADSATMAMLGDETHLYGRIRLGGTLGYALAVAAAGAIYQRYGLPVLFWISAALLGLAWLLSLKLVHRQAAGRIAMGREVRGLLADRRWLGFLILAFAGGLALAASNNYLLPFLRELGASETTMGLTLTLGTVSEIPVLFFGNRLLRRLTARGLLLAAMVITGARLLAFAAAGTPAHVLLIQLLAGLTFPAMWLAGVAYADQAAPPGMAATAQGLFSAVVFGFGTAVGGFGGGLLLEGLGGRGLYLVFGAVVLATVALGALIAAGGRRAKGNPQMTQIYADKG